jgi:hypothetical protein
MTLQADSAGFLIGGKPINPSRPELALLRRLRDDVQAIRRLLAAKEASAKGLGGRFAGGIARPPDGAAARPTVAAIPTRALSPKEIDQPGLAIVRKAATPKRNQAVATRPQAEALGSFPKRDAAGRFVAAEPAVRPAAYKGPAPKDLTANAQTGSRDVKGRFVKEEGATNDAPSGSKVSDLLSDIKDKIGGVDLSGGQEVDPSIKAAQEVAGVAGGAINGIKTMGGVLGSIATPAARGIMGMFRPKPNDAPTPWFRRFFGELRGLRREESAFNRAQLRTLKEIESKPGEGKGGGLLGMLMMLAGPLVAAIGAAITAGFGLLMKMPGMGVLAKLGSALMPAALLPKKPITQPTTAPGAPANNSPAKAPPPQPGGLPAPDAAGKPSEPAPKKPGVLSRVGNGAMGALKRVPVLGALLAAASISAGIYESESDKAATRAEKDKSTGKAVGGGGGAIAGAMAGGSAGAALGMLAGPIGAAIGGVVGAVAGSFFGEKAGAVLGEKVGSWVSDMRNADIPGKLLSGWDKFTTSLGDGFDAVLKKLGLSGVVDKAKDGLLQAGEALKNSAVGRGAIWVLDQFKGAERKAAETAQAYSAGNIAGLDDAQTRALVASTVLTESGGGKLDEVNKQGYIGRYQAGASWLAGAGLMKGGDKAVKDAMKTDGFSNEWKWAESGGMTRFLSNDANWADGMSRSKYLASASAQDAAFKTVSDKNYADLLKRGVVKPGYLPEVVAGYLKTTHIGGAGGALAVSKGGQGASDANGTSARKYFDDVAGDRHGFNRAFKSAGQVPVNAAPPPAPGSPAVATVVTAGVRAIPQMPSLAIEPPKVPDFQPVTQSLANTMAGAKDQRPSVIVVGNKTPAGRDLSSRPLAHIVTGGLSGN